MSKGNKCINLMPKDCKSKTLLFRNNRLINYMFKDNWSHMHVSKVNKLNSLLTPMLLIINLWLDNSKVFKVKILPVVKVIHNGGSLKCHMAKIPHCGGKNPYQRGWAPPYGPAYRPPMPFNS